MDLRETVCEDMNGVQLVQIRVQPGDPDRTARKCELSMLSPNKMKARRSSETSGSAYPAIQRRIPEDLTLKM
jgi:hypothetical protein